jgi:hypothetical protein
MPNPQGRLVEEAKFILYDKNFACQDENPIQRATKLKKLIDLLLM